MMTQSLPEAPPAARAPRKPNLKRIKLSDQVAEELRRWIARENLGPGDRLPHEKQLMEHFSCSKGTIREALKALEVDGLLIMQAGPNGGPEVQATTPEVVIRQMRQYFHFQNLDFKDVYDLRKTLEVMLIESVAGKISDADFARLEANIIACEEAALNEDLATARVVEVEFHDILCQICENPILSLMCRFLNAMLRDLVTKRTASMREHTAFGQHNIDAHRELLTALRANDHDALAGIMRHHMHCAEGYMHDLDAAFHMDLLSRQSDD